MVDYPEGTQITYPTKNKDKKEDGTVLMGA